MTAAPHPEPVPASRVSTLELFFDLVFVFTITQVSDLVLHAHGTVELLRPLLVLALIWWMYGGYAWLTNNVGTAQPLNRVLVLTAMVGFLVMALAVPQAFGRDGLAFGLAYLLVNCIHAALFTRAPDAATARAIWQIAPFNIGTALLVVLAALLPPAWGWLCWVSAVLVLAAVPFFGKGDNFAVEPAHFVERHGLVIIIALGESIIAIGVGAAGQPVTLGLVLAAALMLALNAALWWTYFSRDEQLAEHALASVSGGERARMALYAFGYAHLLMVAGIVLLATGIKQVIGHVEEAEPLATSALLAGGVALYLAADALFRRVMRLPARRARLVAALASLLTIPLGQWAGGLAQIGGLLAVFAGLLVFEHASGG